MTRAPFDESVDSKRLLRWHLTMTTFDLSPANISAEINFTYPSSSTRYLIQTQHYVSQMALPVIFAFGVLGNTANLMILTSRRLYPHRRQASHMERSAVVGLKSLAVSDLLYCLFGFPNRFLVSDRTSPVAIAVTYYMGYKPALINTFLFSSTWLIVLVCVERYIAVCHPFRAVGLIRVRRTVAAHIFVFFVAVLLNIPLFLNAINTLLTDSCRNHTGVNGSTCYFYVTSPYYLSQRIDGHIHHPIWFTFGTFVPLVVIVFSNALLVSEVCRKSQAAAKGGSHAGRDARGGDRGGARSMSSDKGSTMRLTVTLLSIVVCFLVFVVPSMFLQIVAYIERGGSESIRWAVVITNLTQAIKFSSNFILYNIINSTFRQTVARVFRGEGCRNLSSSSPHQKKKDSLCATPLHCAHLKQQQQGQQPGQRELLQTQPEEQQQQSRQEPQQQEDKQTTETTMPPTTATNAETAS